MKRLYKLMLVLMFLGYSNLKSFCTPLYVSVIQNTSSWCGQPTGELNATAYGGQAPYTFQWDVGSFSQTITGLSAGTYNVTVTDFTGATAVGYGIVDDVTSPPFYGLNVNMSSPGLNNGSIEVGMYPNTFGNASYIPTGQVTLILWDQATSLAVETYTETCTYPGCYTIYHTFDSLPPGHYVAEGYVSAGIGGCSSYVDIYLKEIPSITPSFSTLPACNGTGTGKVIGHLNPSPAFNDYTFSSLLSGVFNATPVFTSYKLIFYNGSTPVKTFNTRDSIFMVDGFAPGNYNYSIYAGDTFNIYQNPYLHDSVLYATGSIIVGNDPNCSYVYGRVYSDQNKNCLYDGVDFPLKNILVEFNPGGYSITTDANGDYLLPLPTGTYTLTQHPTYFYKQLCPDSATYLLNNLTPGSSILVNIADSITVEPDLAVTIVGGTARPGFNVNYHIFCSNLTPNYVPSQTLKFEIDNTLSFVAVSDTTAIINGNIYEFTTPPLSAFSTYQVNFLFNVPANSVLGSQLISNLQVTSPLTELNTSNNFDTLIQIITGSYDPNDISVSPVGYTNHGYITNTQGLNYTINFQNTGTDTAFNVTVIDTLPVALDKYSLQVVGFSHPYSYEFKPGNIVAFHFNNLLLPDSNSNEKASHGFIKFKIKQFDGNASGTIIKNHASIYFDYNTPVSTNEVTNTIFDCNQMSTVTLSNSSICASDNLNAIAQTLFPMNVIWLVDTVQVGFGDTLTINNLNSGLHSVETIISNDYCLVIDSNLLTVNENPMPPTITQLGGSLYSSTAFSYQWYFSGQPIQGAINSTYIPQINGYYSVLIVDSNGCSALSDSVNFSSVGLAKLSHDFISIAPNPVDDVLSIFNKSGNEITSIIITDVNGKEYRNYSVQKLTNKIAIDLGEFSNGIYFIKVVCMDATDVFKFIKL